VLLMVSAGLSVLTRLRFGVDPFGLRIPDCEAQTGVPGPQGPLEERHFGFGTRAGVSERDREASKSAPYPTIVTSCDFSSEGITL
jgi:hypothetical protein